MSDSSRIDTRAPDFTLKNHDGQDVHLYEVLKQGPAIVYFYPKDDTPGCTKEACSFRDSFDAFSAAKCQVIGISQDSQEAHQKFRARHGLNFALLTDADGSVAEAWGVKKTLGLFAGRATYVIDQQGTIRHHFVSQFAIERHVQDALEVAQALAAKTA